MDKAEIDLPQGTDLYSDSVYQKANENLQMIYWHIEQGGLIELLRSKELRTRCGNSSLEMIAVHDINHTLRRFEEIYSSVINAAIKPAKSSGRS